MCYIKRNFRRYGLSYTTMKTVITIAGHDLSHGAGITKDLEVFSSLGLHGISVPTSFVIQGPKGATTIEPIEPKLFEEMLRRGGADFHIEGVKIGVAADRAHVEKIVDFLRTRGNIPVVLDPVVSAKNGLKLITDGGLELLKTQLLPLASCITPNLDEAGVLFGTAAHDADTMERSARTACAMGAKGVVIKGGHLEGTPIDLLFDGEIVTTFERKRVEKTVHGTGCLFSSYLLSFLVLGYPLKEAFLETEGIMGRLLAESCQPADDGYFYAFPGLLGIDHKAFSAQRGTE